MGLFGESIFEVRRIALHSQGCVSLEVGSWIIYIGYCIGKASGSSTSTGIPGTVLPLLVYA